MRATKVLYSDFLRRVRDGEVSQALLAPDSILFFLRDTASGGDPAAAAAAFLTDRLAGHDRLVDLLASAGVAFGAAPKSAVRALRCLDKDIMERQCLVRCAWCTGHTAPPPARPAVPWAMFRVSHVGQTGRLSPAQTFSTSAYPDTVVHVGCPTCRPLTPAALLCSRARAAAPTRSVAEGGDCCCAAGQAARPAAGAAGAVCVPRIRGAQATQMTESPVSPISPASPISPHVPHLNISNVSPTSPENAALASRAGCSSPRPAQLVARGSASEPIRNGEERRGWAGNAAGKRHGSIHVGRV